MISNKKLLLFSFITTLISGIIPQRYVTGFIGGRGQGFPVPFWVINDFSDVGGLLPPEQQKFDPILSITGGFVDILFWFMILFLIRDLYHIFIVKDKNLHGKNILLYFIFLLFIGAIFFLRSYIFMLMAVPFFILLSTLQK